MVSTKKSDFSRMKWTLQKKIALRLKSDWCKKRGLRLAENILCNKCGPAAEVDYW